MGLTDRLRRRAHGRERRSTFEKVYRDNGFGGVLSRSGAGSELGATDSIRTQLPGLIERLGIESLLDIPCGDFHWMQHVPLTCRYVGGDIVPEMVQRNAELYSNDQRRFLVLDMVSDELPRADLLLCRDGLVHLSQKDALDAIANFKRSGAGYLLATTFLEQRPNNDHAIGLFWQPLNMTLPPFGFRAPIELIGDAAPVPYEDKSLGLWRLADIPG